MDVDFRTLLQNCHEMDFERKKLKKVLTATKSKNASMTGMLMSIILNVVEKNERYSVRKWFRYIH